MAGELTPPPGNPWSLDRVLFDAERRVANFEELPDVKDIVLIDRLMALLKRFKEDSSNADT